MRIAPLVPLLAALLLPDVLAAQTIRGRVYEYLTSNTITGATIELVAAGKGQRIVTTTDSTGYFILYPPFSGRMMVHATHPSFVAERVDTIEVRERETVTLVVRMTRQAIPIEPIVVTARSASALGGFYERQRRNAFGRYMDEEAIKRRKPVTFTHLMSWFNGVRVETYGGVSRLEMSARGFGPCSPTVIVDGLPMLPDLDLEDAVPLPLVAAVEVYPDPMNVPFEFFTSNFQCGAVAFWTHPVRAGPITWKRIGIATAIIGGLFLAERFIMHSSRSDISDKK